MSLTNEQFNQNHETMLREKHVDLIKNIKELQEIEKYMFQNLQRIEGGGSNDSQEQQEIVQKINELSTMRIGLFNQLKGMYNNNQGELNSSRRQLANEISVVGVVENELNRLKNNISVLEDQKNNKIRMVEIGNYESDRYNAHIGIMKIVVGCSLVVLGASYLLQSGFISSNVSSGIIILTGAYAFITIATKAYDMYLRNNIDYNKYDFPFDRAQLQPGYETVYEHDKKFFSKLSDGISKQFDNLLFDAAAVSKGLHKTSSTLTGELSQDFSDLTANTLNKPNASVNTSNSTTVNNVSDSTSGFVENFASY